MQIAKKFPYRCTFNTGQAYGPNGQIVHCEFTPDITQSPISQEMGDVDGTLTYYDETRHLWGRWTNVFVNDNLSTIESDLKDRFILFSNNNVSHEDITHEEALDIKG